MGRKNKRKSRARTSKKGTTGTKSEIGKIVSIKGLTDADVRIMLSEEEYEEAKKRRSSALKNKLRDLRAVKKGQLVRNPIFEDNEKSKAMVEITVPSAELSLGERIVKLNAAYQDSLGTLYDMYKSNCGKFLYFALLANLFGFEYTVSLERIINSAAQKLGHIRSDTLWVSKDLESKPTTNIEIVYEPSVLIRMIKHTCETILLLIPVLNPSYNKHNNYTKEISFYFDINYLFLTVVCERSTNHAENASLIHYVLGLFDKVVKMDKALEKPLAISHNSLILLLGAQVEYLRAEEEAQAQELERERQAAAEKVATEKEVKKAAQEEARQKRKAKLAAKKAERGRQEADRQAEEKRLRLEQERLEAMRLKQLNCLRRSCLEGKVLSTTYTVWFTKNREKVSQELMKIDGALDMVASLDEELVKKDPNKAVIISKGCELQALITHVCESEDDVNFALLEKFSKALDSKLLIKYRQSEDQHSHHCKI